MNFPFVTLMSYPWLAKSWGGHSTWGMPFLKSVICFLNFAYKLLISVSMEWVVVNMDIIFLTQLETFKVYFLPYENFLMWGLIILWLAILQYHDLQSQGLTNTFLQNFACLLLEGKHVFFSCSEGCCVSSNESLQNLTSNNGFGFPVNVKYSRLKSPSIHIGLYLYLLYSLFISSN